MYPSANFAKSVTSSPGEPNLGRVNAFTIYVSVWVHYSCSVGWFDHGDASYG